MAWLLLHSTHCSIRIDPSVSEPAVKHNRLPANDSDYEKAVDAGDEIHAEPSHQKPARVTNDNSITRAIEEFREIIDEMDDLREVLRAHAIPLRTTRMIVEFGVQNKPDKQALAIDAAMEEAEKSLGQSCLSRDVLENHISTIVTLERNLTHARSAAREEGLDASALSTLLQMIQKSPGDNGASAVNTFLAYALAYGVKTDKLKEIAGNFSQRSNSVLPQIPRGRDEVAAQPVKKLVQDAVIGLFIGICVIYLLV